MSDLSGRLLRAEHRPLAAVVVEQGVDRLLQHALFVADDDFRRVEVDQLLEPVVAVDDAAIEIVQIAGGEVAAIEQHERPQVGRNDRDALQHHPFGLVCGPPMPLSRSASTTLSRLTRSRCFCLDGFSFSSQGPSSSRSSLDSSTRSSFSSSFLIASAPMSASKVVAVGLAGLAIFFLGEELSFLERRARPGSTTT